MMLAGTLADCVVGDTVLAGWLDGGDSSVNKVWWKRRSLATTNSCIDKLLVMKHLKEIVLYHVMGVACWYWVESTPLIKSSFQQKYWWRLCCSNWQWLIREHMVVWSSHNSLVLLILRDIEVRTCEEWFGVIYSLLKNFSQLGIEVSKCHVSLEEVFLFWFFQEPCCFHSELSLDPDNEVVDNRESFVFCWL